MKPGTAADIEHGLPGQSIREKLSNACDSEIDPALVNRIGIVAPILAELEMFGPRRLVQHHVDVHPYIEQRRDGSAAEPVVPSPSVTRTPGLDRKSLLQPLVHPKSHPYPHNPPASNPVMCR